MSKKSEIFKNLENSKNFQSNSTKIELSKKDIKKGLRFPTTLSKDLAYLCGYLAGDGSIYTREYKHDYIIKGVGDPKSEKEYYHNVIGPLFKKLFNLDLNLKIHDSGETYGFAVYSKALLTYLTKNIGLPCGKKYETLKIPIIFKNKKELLISFLRGLADTDFYLGLKRGSKKNPHYPVIVGSSKSFKFMDEVASELEKFGFRVTKYFNSKQLDKRFKKGYSIINRVELCGHENYRRWMSLIGFSNPRHIIKTLKIKY